MTKQLQRSQGWHRIWIGLGCAVLALVALPASAQFTDTNDFFSSARNLNAESSPLTDTTAQATVDPGEPLHLGTGGASVWFKYTATNSGVLTIDTFGSSFDTVLVAYKGTNLSTLTRVAGNDDIDANNTNSLISFPTASGTTYFIVVDGYAPPGQPVGIGAVTLNWVAGKTTAPSVASPSVFGFNRTSFTVTEYESFAGPFGIQSPLLRSAPGAVVAVTRTGSRAGRMLVDVAAVDGTGVAGSDYDAPPATLVFDNFQDTAKFVLPIISDGSSNGTKSLTLQLSNPRLDPSEDPSLPPPVLQLGLDAAAMTILELFKETSATNFNIERKTYALREDEGSINVDVILTQPFGTPAQVNVTVAASGGGFHVQAGSDGAISAPATFSSPTYTDGTTPVTTPADYVSQNVTLTFPPGSQRQSVTLVVNNDADVELAEDILVSLTPAANSPGVGPNPTAVVTIVNDDLAAGELDPEWNPDNLASTTPRFNRTPGANSIVRALAVQADQKTILAGDFTAYNSVPRSHLARINNDGSNDAGFTPGTGADDFVTSVALYTSGANSGKILIGGGFTSYNGTQRNGVARLNADGTLDAGFTVGVGANATVRSVALQPDGKVLVAGDFTTFNGASRPGVARLNANGSVDNSFNPALGADGTVWAVAVQAGKVYLGGEFQNFNNVFRGGVARLNDDGSLDLGYDPGGGADGPVYAILPQANGRLLVAGSFNVFDFRSRPNITRLDATGSPDLTYDSGTGANDAIYALTLQSDGKILAGGLFTSFNGTRRMGLTRLFVNGTVDTSFLDTAYNQFAGLPNSLNLAAPNYVNALAVQADGSVLIGGSFTNVGGHASQTLDRFRYPVGEFSELGVAASGAWSRQDRRARYNVARLVGGYTPGPGNVQYLSSSYTIDEFAGTLQAAMQRRDGRLGSVSAQAITTDNLAVAGVDFGYRKTTITWPQFGDQPAMAANVAEQYFSIPIANDSLTEGDELFPVSLRNPIGEIALGGQIIPTGLALGSTAAVVDIVDDDFKAGSIVFAASTFATNENAGTLRISVVRTNGSHGSVGVGYVVRSGTAIAGQDFNVALSGTLSFGSGDTVKILNIALINDAFVEPDETFTITLTNATGGAVVPGGSVSTTGLIIDNDLLVGKANFSSASYSTNEDSGFAIIPVIRLGGSVGELSVDAVAAAGTATAGTDFSAITTNILWVDGDVGAKLVYVPLTADNSVEANETVSLSLVNPSVVGGVGGVGTATLTIANDDFFGSLSFNQSLYDADERGTNVTITVVRTGGLGGTVTVNYAAINGTAVNGTDFVLASGSLTLGPGVSATNFDVGVINNGLTDGERFATLNLGGFVNATAGQFRSARLRILDDESTGDPAGSMDTAFNPFAGGTNAIHSLVLQPDGRMLVGGEFRTLNRVLRNRIGRLNEDGSLDDSFDAKQGPNQPVRAVALQADGRVVLGGFFTTVGGTNRNYIARLLADGTVDRFFNPGAGADNPVFAVGIDGNARVVMGGSFVTVNGISRPGIAVLDESGDVSSSFNPGLGFNGSVLALAVQPDGKYLVGGDFTIYQNVLHPYLVRLNADGSVDSHFTPGTGPDGAVRSIVLQPDGRILIGGSFTNYDGTFRGRLARLASDGSLDSTFMTSVVGGDAAVNSMALQFDGKLVVVGEFSSFNAVSRRGITRLNRNGKTDPTINFGAGLNDAVNAVAIQQDRRIVIGGRFTTLDNQPRLFLARIFGGSVAGPGSLEFSEPVYAVPENAGPATIKVVRRGGTTSDITVDYYSGDGSATPGADYTPVSSTLTFLEGENEMAFTVPLVNDGLGEPNESVPLLLTNQTAGVSLGAVPRSQLIIVNDDSGVGFASAGFSVSESAPSGGVLISVIRSGATNGTATVGYRTANGTALAGLDYSSRNGTLTFNPGESLQTFTVPILEDTLIEGNESFLVLLTNLVGGAALSQPSATVTITDNDFRPGDLRFSATSYSVLESAGTVTVTVTRTNGVTGVVTVDFTVSSGVAQAGNDFVAQAGTLVFGDGQTSASINITILDDALVEGDEDLVVSLSNPGGGSSILGSTTVSVVILDEEFGPGSVDRVFDSTLGVNGPVRSVVVQPGGQILMAGAFTRFSTNSRNHVVRLNSDGTLDLTFDPGVGPNALISSVAPGPNGKVLVAGAFDRISGVSFNRLGRLNSDGTPDLTFNRSLTINAGVDTLALQADGRILYGGGFSLPTRGVGRLFVDGNVDPSFDIGSGADAPVHAVRELTDGSIVVAGAFGLFSGDVHSRVAVLTSGGQLNTSFATGAILDGSIFGVVEQADGKLIVVGDFLTTASTNRLRIARLNRDGTLDGGYNVGRGANATVYCVALQSSGQAIIGGDFTSVNGTNRVRFARLNIDGALDTTFDPGRGANNTVFSMTVLADDDILIAGDFTSVGGLPRQGVARIQGSIPGPAPFGFAGVSRDGGILRLKAQAPTGRVCVLQRSVDLKNWTAVSTNAAVAGQVQFSVPVDPAVSARYFRIKGGSQ